MVRKFYFIIVMLALIAISGCKGGGGGGGPSASAPVPMLYAENILAPEIEAMITPTGFEPEGPDDDGEPIPGDPDEHMNPEPATLVMFGMSLLGLFGLRLKKARG